MAGLIGGLLGGLGQGAVEVTQPLIAADANIMVQKAANDFHMARDGALSRLRTEEHAANAATDLTNRPKIKQIDNDATIDLETRRAGVPLGPKDQAAVDKLRAETDYTNTVRGEVARSQIRKNDAAASGTRAADAQLSKEANSARASLFNVLSKEKDENGAPRYTGDQILAYQNLTGSLVLAGYSVDDAKSMAMSAPITSKAEAARQAAADYENPKTPKTWMGGNVKLPGGGEATKEEYIKQRGGQLAAEGAAKMAQWAEENGVRLPGNRMNPAPSSEWQPPAGTEVRNRKTGEIFVSDGEKPIPKAEWDARQSRNVDEAAIVARFKVGIEQKKNPADLEAELAQKLGPERAARIAKAAMAPAAATAKADAGAFDQAGSLGTGMAGLEIKRDAKMQPAGPGLAGRELFVQIPNPPGPDEGPAALDAWEKKYGKQYDINEKLAVAMGRENYENYQRERLAEKDRNMQQAALKNRVKKKE